MKEKKTHTKRVLKELKLKLKTRKTAHIVFFSQLLNGLFTRDVCFL